MDVEWDEYNRREIAAHAVSEAEAERATEDLGLLLGVVERGGERRLLRLGRTAAGRVLAVVLTPRGTGVRVVTARDASPKERRRWRQLHG
jgi:uncharacterized DUF497 family protein